MTKKENKIYNINDLSNPDIDQDIEIVFFEGKWYVTSEIQQLIKEKNNGKNK